MSIIKFIIKVIAGFLIVVFTLMLIIAALAPSPEEVSNAIDDIKVKVATDAETRYEMAKSSGTLIDQCVQAGAVAAAWMQAHDDEKYASWKQVELADCKRAGVPR